MKFKIGELARQAGCRVVTIRYYEKEGLLRRPERSDGNYRLYDEGDLERLRFIRRCRLHGMSLREVGELLSFQDQPRQSCDWISALVRRHMDNVDAQIAGLQHLREHLERLLRSCDGGRAADCGILEHLRREEDCARCCGQWREQPSGRERAALDAEHGEGAGDAAQSG